MAMPLRTVRLAALLVPLIAPGAFAQGAPADPPQPAPPTASDQYAIVSAGRGLSYHKPMYVIPISYSPEYRGDDTEVIFQISGKQQLFGTNFYIGYTQKSFWQAYNRPKSALFRETNYNPEIFYRWSPERLRWYRWGADLGFEHESNGQSLPDSRSWNRVYASAFQPRGSQLIHLKLWYRIPEDPKASPEDSAGDDNPDIEDYYGYGEVQWKRQIGGKQLVSVMGRGNPATGRGAVSLEWSMPLPNDEAFFGVWLWHGYGESLIDYNDSVTRVGVGVLFSR